MIAALLRSAADEARALRHQAQAARVDGRYWDAGDLDIQATVFEEALNPGLRVRRLLTEARELDGLAERAVTHPTDAERPAHLNRAIAERLSTKAAVRRQRAAALSDSIPPEMEAAQAGFASIAGDAEAALEQRKAA